MAYKPGTSSASRKELERQVRLHHPVPNHVTCDDKKEGLADSLVPVVASSPDRAVLGFSTPPISTKKSRER